LDYRIYRLPVILGGRDYFGGEMNKIFPTILIVLDVCAALAYVPAGDWRKIGYWISAAAITFFVTY
jgi:hypothetical protein